MSKWTISIDGRHQGPYSEVELEAMMASSQIDADTPVWSRGLPDFQPIRTCLPRLVPQTNERGDGAADAAGAASRRWLVRSRGETLGPMSSDDVRTLARVKGIDPDAMVRRVSESEWRPLFSKKTDADRPHAAPQPTDAAARPAAGTIGSRTPETPTRPAVLDGSATPPTPPPAPPAQTRVSPPISPPPPPLPVAARSDAAPDSQAPKGTAAAAVLNDDNTYTLADNEPPKRTAVGVTAAQTSAAAEGQASGASTRARSPIQLLRSKPLVAAAVGLVLIAMIGLFTSAFSSKSGGFVTGGFATGRMNGTDSPLSRAAAAIATLSSYMEGNSLTAGCEDVAETFDELAEALEAFMADADTVESIIDGRWQTSIGPRFLAVRDGLADSGIRILRDIEARKLCGKDVDQRIEASLQRGVAALGKVDNLVARAVLEKAVRNTRAQQERARQGIPEPTPYRCRWCGRPMTADEHASSEYCSRKCQTENEVKARLGR